MINLNGFRCHSYQEFSKKLEELDKDIEIGNVTNEGFCKISEFIENNQDLFVGNQRTALLLDSIGAKLGQRDAKDPLINTLQKHVEQLLPTNREQVKVSLQFFRNTILNVSERLQSMADWISVMKIPLAHLDLSVEELASLLLRLEHIDLTDYHFESHDLALLTRILIKSEFKFKTKDATVLGIMARVCAKGSVPATAFLIKNFEIKDPSVRIEIALFCAELDGYTTATYIKKFEIVDPAARAKIALACARGKLYFEMGTWATVFYIKDFEIEDPVVRGEIALFCATQSGRKTAQGIKKFEIEDPDMRAKIALLCAQQNEFCILGYIKNFEITDTAVLLEIARHCVARWGDVAELIKRQDLEGLPLEELFNEIDQLIPKLGFPENSQQTLIKTSQEVRALPPHNQKVIGLWLMASMITMSTLKKDAIEWMMRSKEIWRELALLRDPGLRILLTQGLYELSSDVDKRKSWEIFLSSVRGVEGQRGLMLLAIPFFALQRKGIQEERLIEIALELAKSQKKDKTSPFRNVNHIKNIVHTMLALASTDAFPVEMKKAAFEKIFSSSDEKKIIKNIIAAKGLLQLKDQDWPTRVEDLTLLFSNSIEKVIPLDNCMENVSEKYDEIFSSSRNPVGLLTYAAGLKTLGEPEVMACLGRYVVSVLNGTFKEKRYTVERNPHLAKIMESNDRLLGTWKEDLSFDLEALTSSDSAPVAFNPSEWLKMKLITDRHLGDTKLTFVTRYLAEDSNKEEVFQELISQINVSRKEKDSLLAQLNLEKACLNFIQKGERADKNVLMQLLMEINNALTNSTTFAASEFAKDVKGLKEGFGEELKSKGKTKEGLKVLFTDNPIDLLLCGTDVSGSCQRLGGNAYLNCGLLGYLIDGKNRLLAIQEGNKIIARCMLSLLWDGKQPVIYRERFYPDTTPENYKTALNALAKKVATKLNVPLTSNDPGVPYGKRLEALGGPAPYEYSDGGGGVKKNGQYTIQEAYQIV